MDIPYDPQLLLVSPTKEDAEAEVERLITNMQKAAKGEHIDDGLSLGDTVRVKAGYGWGLNRDFRRACTKRRPPRITRFFGDAALINVTKGTQVLGAWVNRKELERI